MRKKLIRLTESDLHRIIRNSVKRVIRESKFHNNRIMNEGGNLATYDDDGKLTWTNSKDTWRGVEGTKYIWHGQWSDPEVWYNGELYNASDLEDGLWQWYQEYCDEEGTEPTEDGYEEWIKTEDLESYLMDAEYGMYGEG